MQFNKAPAISICFLQLFLLFESWAIKAQFESCHFSHGNLYHFNCPTWSFNYSQVSFLLSGERTRSGTSCGSSGLTEDSLHSQRMCPWCPSEKAFLANEHIYAPPLLFKCSFRACPSAAMIVVRIPLHRIDVFLECINPNYSDSVFLSYVITREISPVMTIYKTIYNVSHTIFEILIIPTLCTIKIRECRLFSCLSQSILTQKVPSFTAGSFSS